MLNIETRVDYLIYKISKLIICNICGAKQFVRFENLRREVPSCKRCGSSVRMRQLIHCLSQQLFGKSMVLAKMTTDKKIKGIGLSDWESYANLLAKKFNYINTFYHKEPLLDITNPPEDMANTLNFIISSDVFEHVLPPAQHAFAGAYSLLKPGGCLILTVPYREEGQTVERYPNMLNYRLYQENDQWRMENTTVDGQKEIHTQLIFHGGPGNTLELRQFSLPDLIENLKSSGFKDIQVHNKPFWKYGIYMPESWSYPITAVK